METDRVVPEGTQDTWNNEIVLKNIMACIIVFLLCYIKHVKLDCLLLLTITLR